jgi:hypothetical protein
MMRMKNNFNGIFIGLLLLTVTAGGAFLPSCNSFKSCPEQVALHMPVADSLFVAVDSAGFFKSAGRVRLAADCVARDGDASAAEKLDARLSKARVDQLVGCWSCHSQIHDMAEFHTVLIERSSEVSEEDWKEAMTLWNAMVCDVEHPSMKCTDDDRAVLLAMKAELTVVDVVGGGWQELFEEAGEEIENVLDEGLQMLEDLFRE